MQRALDAVAVGLSGLCFVHCLLLPIGAVSLPFLGAFAQAEWVHWLFVGMAAPIAVFAIGPSLVETPRAWAIASLAVAGVLFLLAGATDIPSHEWGTGLTIAGGAVLATAHLLNRSRLHKMHHH